MAKREEGISEKLIKYATAEFLKKGFQGASLREIAKHAGISTGAIYIRFPDKAALFGALVEPAADDLKTQFQSAQDSHFDLIDLEKSDKSWDLTEEYVFSFIDCIYENYDAFKLIVCRSEGSRYQSFFDELVELEVDRTIQYHNQLRSLGKLQGSVSPEVHHMLTSALFTAVLEVVQHDMSKEEALKYIGEVMRFFTCGWNGLLTFL
ncbi:MAG: TetR/AcrR family transcriptional regulator [Suipraeoptans sp.]